MATRKTGSDYMSDRYKYDFRLCTPAKGWAQLDTLDDAPYYGNWVNPIHRALVSFCEGDVSVTECVDDADFVATVRACVAWHKERGSFIGIDPMGSDKIAAAFTRLGLADLLHRATVNQ